MFFLESLAFNIVAGVISIVAFFALADNIFNWLNINLKAVYFAHSF